MAFIINGEKFSDELIEEEFESIKDHYVNMGEAVCCDRDEEFRTYARDNIINRALLERASEEKFGDASQAEIDGMFEQLKADHGGEENFFQNTGFNPGDEGQIKRKIKSTIKVDKLLESHLGAETEPTEEEIRGFYDENIAKFMTEEEVQLSQIFVEPQSHEAARESYQVLRQLREDILDEKIDFLAAAEKYGDVEKQSIDMGYMKQGETMPEIEAITFSLRDGEVSPVVATQFGFHIFKLMDRRMPAPTPFEDIKATLPEQFSAKRREDNINALIDELKAAATIEEIEEPLEA